MYDKHQTLTQALSGVLGGIAGGTAMTIMMTKVGPRLVPRDVLPDTPAPQKVVQWAQSRAGVPEALDGESKDVAALALHLAYSATSGAVYGVARSALPPLRGLPAPAAGFVFGLVVWAVSFEGLLPALGVMKRTTEHPPKRWPAPLLGHSVFGVVTALTTDQLGKRLH